MAYPDFDFDPASVEERLGVGLRSAHLFPDLVPAPVPGWLTDHLERTRGLALMTEKVRSEFLVAPTLLAAREIYGCVTTGEDWQFLRLEDDAAAYDAVRRHISELDELLGVFARIAADTA